MKNLVLVLVFVLFGSFAFATSSLDKTIVFSGTSSIETQIEEGPYVCYEIRRTEETNPMTGVTTITITYRCVDLAML